MRAVQSLHKDSLLTGVWPGHHRDKGDPEFARRQVQRGHPDAVWQHRFSRLPPSRSGTADSRENLVDETRPKKQLRAGIFPTGLP